MIFAADAVTAAQRNTARPLLQMPASRQTRLPPVCARQRGVEGAAALPGLPPGPADNFPRA
jgi:hypothetical protein